jgi:hypothetical protein
MTGVRSLIVPAGPAPPAGRTITGTIVPGRGWAPGGQPPAPDVRHLDGVQLVDAAHHVLARGRIAAAARGGYPTLTIPNAPSCAGCFVELVEAGGHVGDRQPVTLDEAPPAVSYVSLADGWLTGGPWVGGSLQLTSPASASDLKVTVVAADGRRLTDSTNPALGRCGPARGTSRAAGCTHAKTFTYRLGNVPPDYEGAATVHVLIGSREVGRTTVHLGPDVPEAYSTLLIRNGTPPKR